MNEKVHYLANLGTRCLACGQEFHEVDGCNSTTLETLAGELLSVHLGRSKGCCREYVELDQVVRFCNLQRVIPATVHVRLRPRGYEVRGVTWPEETQQLLRVFRFGSKGEPKEVARRKALQLVEEIHGRLKGEE